MGRQVSMQCHELIRRGVAVHWWKYLASNLKRGEDGMRHQTECLLLLEGRKERYTLSPDSVHTQDLLV